MAQPAHPGGAYDAGRLRAARTFLERALVLDADNAAAAAFLQKVGWPRRVAARC
jgi:hypothetical protein